MDYDLFVVGATRYLGRNVREMVATVAAMNSLGMLFTSRVPAVPTVGHELTLGDYDRHGRPVSDAARAYWREWEPLLTDHGSPTSRYVPGIPDHKLATNDGWHITRRECSEALREYKSALAAGARHPCAFGNTLIPFLRKAVRHNGFRVH